MSLRLFQHKPTKLYAAARLLMSILFLVSGVSKLGAPEQTKAYMEAYGVPGYLLYPAAALEIGGSGMLLADHNPPHARWLAMVLVGWCLLTASIFHTDLKNQEQKINLMKNMAMAGGFLVLAEDTEVECERMLSDWDAEGMGTADGEERRSPEKARWRPGWATWSEALAARPEVFSDTKERMDI